ncbi:hypothetical protein JTE90_019857 [Oedothorax gibbosus]|uniref:Uncharacterized protein n=1 Tax=Oedothorax gibbosus TaxID=931172 RepID=A0AAV6VYT3_9ARAC|nr:hypothetical protein JTE90_019857 [Oedothorax gibbosus]
MSCLLSPPLEPSLFAPENPCNKKQMVAALGPGKNGSVPEFVKKGITTYYALNASPVNVARFGRRWDVSPKCPGKDAKLSSSNRS